LNWAIEKYRNLQKNKIYKNIANFVKRACEAYLTGIFPFFNEEEY
jgi:hypothetical protein